MMQQHSAEETTEMCS